MSAVLLSIKPKYVNAIMKGGKTWEFRRSIWKYPINRVYIYKTKPAGYITAFFEVTDIIEDSIEHLYELCENDDNPVISEKEFFRYFKGKQTGFAIKIKEIIPIESTVCLSYLGLKRAPQSFCYLSTFQSHQLNIISLEAN